MPEKQKRSRQREAIYELLKSVTCHPSAEWLYNELKHDFPKLSLATVYRNLSVLCAQGEAIRLDVGDGTVRYDAHTKGHNHFFCKVCKSLSDIGDSEAGDIDAMLAERYGVSIDSHSFVFYGNCRECNKKLNS